AVKHHVRVPQGDGDVLRLRLLGVVAEDSGEKLGRPLEARPRRRESLLLDERGGGEQLVPRGVEPPSERDGSLRGSLLEALSRVASEKRSRAAGGVGASSAAAIPGARPRSKAKPTTTSFTTRAPFTDSTSLCACLRSVNRHGCRLCAGLGHALPQGAGRERD